MRYNKLILPIVLALFVIPLAITGRMAAAAGQPDVQGFRIQLFDGSLLKGAVSFTMDIDTQYGRLAVSSANLVSAHFDSTSGWADIRTQGVQLRVQFKPDSSDLKAATDLGPVSVDLTKVISVEANVPQVPSPAPLAAPSPYDQASQAPAPASDIYPPPAPPVDNTPYDYGASALYGEPSYVSSGGYGYPYGYPYSNCYPYCTSGLYGYPYGYPYCAWPGYNFGCGIGAFNGFGWNHFGFNNRFAGQFSSRGFGFARNGFGAGSAAFGSVRQFNGAAGLNRSASARTFSSPSFRSGASFSRGSFSRGGFSHGGSSGGFSHGGGFGGHGGGRGR